MVPTYEQAVGTTCDESTQYSNGDTCTVYCSTAVTRTCSCTETLGGIITILKEDGCEWIGDDCIIETTETSIATSVETDAENIEYVLPFISYYNIITSKLFNFYLKVNVRQQQMQWRQVFKLV